MKRLCRSVLFIPGNTPSMLQHADLFQADCVVLDLEDAVSIKEKDSARLLVRNALNSLTFGETQRVVRINALDTAFAEKDVEIMAQAAPDALMVPKATPEHLRWLDQRLQAMEKAGEGRTAGIQLIPIIENPGGVVRLSEVLKATPRVCAALLGGEDLTASMGISRTRSGEELSYIRSALAYGCHDAGIDAIDAPFADVLDDAGFREDAARAKALGLTGKAAIHPRQVEMIHQQFAPSEEEVQQALRILKAMEQADQAGKGVVSLEGRMVDAPVLKRAEKVVFQAQRMGMLAASGSEKKEGEPS